MSTETYGEVTFVMCVGREISDYQRSVIAAALASVKMLNESALVPSYPSAGPDALRMAADMLEQDNQFLSHGQIKGISK